MHENSKHIERAILVGVHTGSLSVIDDTTEESLAELSELAKTAGAEVVGSICQNRDQIDKATYVGEGKLQEIKDAAATLSANLIIVDSELTGSQLRNMEDFLELRVIDRSALILDIFAERALSAEGKLQVELAQLKYSLPRLSGGYKSLSRLGGGIGTRGPGETKLETDRRHIRNRINALEGEIREIGERRALMRARREKNEVPTAALVGYTNAGKSTTLNRLTDAGVFAENMLFATLDPTARALTMSDGREAVIIDTVGFIRKLPHHLIEAFKSTLEEAVYADVLIHVIDSSSPEMDNQKAVVEELISKLGISEKPIITVYNKCDISGFGGPITPQSDNFVCMSAAIGDGLDRLLDILDSTLPGKRVLTKILVPYTEGGILHTLREQNALISEDYTPDGILTEFMADARALTKYKQYIKED